MREGEQEGKVAVISLFDINPYITMHVNDTELWWP